MGDTIQSLIANVIQSLGFTNGDEHFIARAILDQPEVASIIDLAAVGLSNKNSYTDRLDPEVRALLAAWRASRAEQEPER